MLSIDLNCDLGEGFENDADIMPFISSANIACGFHAGDKETMLRTVALAIENEVTIGAHPSFADKTHFGRLEMELPPDQVYDIVSAQILLLSEIVKTFDISIHHVKPHGALYNMAAKNKKMALSIARAVKEFDQGLILYGLSGSKLIEAAHEIGIKSCEEVFADRVYRDDASLMPRTDKNALITETGIAVKQALQLAEKRSVKTDTGKLITLAAETLCIHGDGKFALHFASEIHNALIENGISIKSPSCPSGHNFFL